MCSPGRGGAVAGAAGVALNRGAGARLHDAADLRERAARGVVRVRGGLGHVEDRREADLGAEEQPLPLRARPGAELGREARAQRRPRGGVELGGRVHVVEPHPLEHRRVELRLERADRDVVPSAAS